MSEKVKRISALVIALLFLLSTIGFTGLVIFQMTQQDDADTANQLTEEPEVNENALAGTQLKNFETLESVKELKIVDIKEGDGKTVKKGDTVTAHYTGALAKTGVIFESSLDSGQPATFGLAQVIEGWQEGVPGMKVGGTRRLIIPADLAYGDQASPTIPANSPLVFDIEMIDVE